MLPQITILQQRLVESKRNMSYYLSLHSKYPSDESIKDKIDELSDEEYKLEKEIKRLKR